MLTSPLCARWRAILALLLVAACCLPAGCASVTAKVTSFNVWPADTQGADFSYLRPVVSTGELEQATYENYVGSELQRLGLKPSEGDKPPRFLAEVVADHTTREKKVLEPMYQNQLIFSPPFRDPYGNVFPGYWAPSQYGSPLAPGFIGAYPSGVGGFGSGFGSVYLGDREVMRTFQVNRLRLRLLDAKAGTAGRPRVVFEASAVYEGENEDLAELMPYLVQAVFTGFPGKSGQVRLVKFEERKREVVKR